VPPSKSDQERWWADAWNDLFDIVDERTDARCKLPDETVVDVEVCKGWLQDQAYDGWKVGVRAGTKGDGVQVVAWRWRPEDDMKDAPK
jgi:hypothetical protein